MVILDKNGANKTALDELSQRKPKDKAIRKNKYLNKMIEQERCNVKHVPC
ncbi:hypothetical protein [Xenorhabdus griffiniae]